ncbi:TonB family protein [Acinetobacter sp. 194]|uniref:energy transducer TonB n=1 Tax=Acinetobacter shaoyimingii TaxID=2715164 RepID=UPI00140DBC58|nr:TonB family protein [Acinetobacter shaoyimingii]NHB57982.1 TonB family protein [Acinetobacter shaoyimingii]
MIKKIMEFSKLTQQWWDDQLFLLAAGVAVIIHVLFISVHFEMPPEHDLQNKEIAVTLRPSNTKINEADYFAQEDQEGSGVYRNKYRMTSEMPAQTQDLSAGDAQMEALEKIQQQRELKFEEKVLMTVLSWKKQASEKERKKALDELQSQFEAKAAMVASLEAQYLKKNQNFSRQQKIQTVDGVQAKKLASAGYLDKFREKVEMYGNRYYPELAKQQRLAGEVRLMVILNASGGIRAIRLIESSGHSILDEAAKNSVRKAAPFGAFDAKMRKDISELRIVRTWKFDPADAEFEVH